MWLQSAVIFLERHRKSKQWTDLPLLILYRHPKLLKALIDLMHSTYGWWKIRTISLSPTKSAEWHRHLQLYELKETAATSERCRRCDPRWVEKTFSGIFAEIILFRIEFISSALRIGRPLVWRDIDEIPIVVQSSRSVWSVVFSWPVATILRLSVLRLPCTRTWYTGYVLCPQRRCDDGRTWLP